MNVERSAIATAAKQYAEAEIKEVIPIIAQAEALKLPVVSVIKEYIETLRTLKRFCRRLR